MLSVRSISLRWITNQIESFLRPRFRNEVKWPSAGKAIGRNALIQLPAFPASPVISFTEVILNFPQHCQCDGLNWSMFYASHAQAHAVINNEKVFFPLDVSRRKTKKKREENKFWFLGKCSASKFSSTTKRVLKSSSTASRDAAATPKWNMNGDDQTFCHRLRKSRRWMGGERETNAKSQYNVDVWMSFEEVFRKRPSENIAGSVFLSATRVFEQCHATSRTGYFRCVRPKICYDGNVDAKCIHVLAILPLIFARSTKFE